MKTYEWQGVTYEVVSFDTKRGKLLAKRCENYCGEYLYQVYDNPSEAKREAFNKWHYIYAHDVNAELFSIVSHTCHKFSLGWFTELPEPISKGMERNVAILITPPSKNYPNGRNYMIVFPESYKAFR